MVERRSLTPAEKASAKRANTLWQKKKRADKISQTDAASSLKMTASAFNQYINAKIPLNTDATYALAIYFGVKPREIDPEWLDESVLQIDDTTQVQSIDEVTITDGGKRGEAKALLAELSGHSELELLRYISEQISTEGAAQAAAIFSARVQRDLAKSGA